MFEEGVLVFRGKERVWIEMNTPPSIELMLFPRYPSPPSFQSTFIQVNIFFSFSFRPPSVSLTFSAFPVPQQISPLFIVERCRHFSRTSITEERVGRNIRPAKRLFEKSASRVARFHARIPGKRLMEALADRSISRGSRANSAYFSALIRIPDIVIDDINENEISKCFERK